MFDVKLHNRTVGRAEICRKGLYNEITCKCSFPDKRQYRIYANCSGKQTDLGICVPYDGLYGFRTKIATKSMGEGHLDFVAVAADLSFCSVEVDEDKPFPNLMKLRKGRYQLLDGKPCITFRDPDR